MREDITDNEDTTVKKAATASPISLLPILILGVALAAILILGAWFLFNR